MYKGLVISLKDSTGFSYKGVRLDKKECKHICEKAGDYSEDEYEKALNIIIKRMCDDSIYRIDVDIDEREAIYAPAKEMTIEEIEKELGHKVKIISNETGENK